MIELLNRLLAFIEAFLRKKEQAKTQELGDEIEKDPYDFFNSHFGYGVQSDNAKKTDKTDSDSHT